MSFKTNDLRATEKHIGAVDMSAVIQLDKVTKRLGPHVALNEVSFEVPPGSVFALLGDNGAGKTTAIRIMLGMLDADSGHCQVLGLDSAKQGLEIRRRVGYVAERPTLYEWMTVEEIGWFAAGFYDDEYLPRYRRLAADFDLPSRQKIKNLSKGMRAKVSLSLALALDPELLVLDEPTSGLDALVRREFLESMVDRAATGRTVFLSSHQIGEVEKVADYVAVLSQSNLLMVERLDELKQQVREVTLTLAAGATPPEVTGEIISRRQHARQWKLLVRNLPEKEPALLKQHPAVQAVELHAPSLEEIFVAYIERSRPGTADRSPEDFPREAVA
jgi:ABC-2 type transport system ATP-binding protein